MRVLIVGAGAVGQVYGHHLQRGGAEVTFLVKPRYETDARAGFTLWRLRRLGRPRRVIMAEHAVTSDASLLAEQRWDQVWLCVSSTALRRPWLAEVLAATGDATIVALQPGLDDRGVILRHADERRLVQGVITLIAYQAPLPDDDVPGPGVAFWIPPLTVAPFAGPADRVAEVVRVLRGGGLRASRREGAALAAATASAVMMPHLVALEAEGWSLARLATGELLPGATRAAHQALAIVVAETGRRPPVWARAVRPGVVRVLLRVARWVLPLPLGTYLAYHFTKVGDQTRLMIRTYLERGRTNGQPVDALEELTRMVPFG